jgi:hypothetical protein
VKFDYNVAFIILLLRTNKVAGMPDRAHFMKLARDVGLFTTEQRASMPESCNNEPALVYDAVVATALSKNADKTNPNAVLQNLQYYERVCDPKH